MAFSRQMRKSGSSSSSPAPAPQVDRQTNGAYIEPWIEPEVRVPAPSFEDYRGLERQGVLEHMSALEARPGGLKGRGRGGRALEGRGASIVKARNTKPATDGVYEPLVRVSSPGAEPLSPTRALEPPIVVETLGEPQVAEDDLSPTSKPPTSQGRWQKIVDSAVKRASDLGNVDLGLAIRKLYNESLHDQALARLLDAVLSQRQTPQQAATFQVYVKKARKKLKREMRMADSPAPSIVVPRSPSANATPAPERSLRRPERMAAKKGKGGIARALRLSPTDSLMLDRPSSREGRSPKRLKRSGSAISDSSLTSVGSNVEALVHAEVSWMSLGPMGCFCTVAWLFS